MIPRNNGTGANASEQESAFAARRPTPSHANDDSAVSHLSMSPPDALMYPSDADVGRAALTAFEEQPPRGEAWGIPSMVVLRHRMGFSTVVLTAHQRKTYSRCDLENFVLYKEQKYNAVNVLWRFCMMLLVVLTFSIFCLVFSTCTTEWVGLQQADRYLSVGLFVACRDSSLRSCSSRVSSRLEWTVTDAVTGATLCTASASFVHRFIGTTWAMAILQLLCELIALALTAWIVARPTRSKALLVLFFDLLFGTICGIIAVVLFHHYSSCIRRTCEGEHLSSPMCSVSWRYGYKLFLGSLAVHGVALLLALCMHSYIHNIRVTARKQLQAERRRASHRHAEAEDYMVHVLDGSAAGDGNAERKDEDAAAQAQRGSRGDADAAVNGSVPPSTPNEMRRLATTQRGGDGRRGDEMSDNAATPFLPTYEQQQEQLARSATHVSFAGVPSTHGKRGPSSRDPRNGSSGDGGAMAPPTAAARDPLSSSMEQSAFHGTDDSARSGGSGSDDVVLTHLTAPTERTDRSELTSYLSFPPPTQQRQYQGGSAAYPVGSRHRPQHRPVAPTSTAQRRPSADTPAYRHARKQRVKRNRLFDRFFQREYDAAYLTAAELGVPIAGASDWVYDDRSDMYYSFDRNMFWDPLTCEYYNCELKTWQESPDQVVDVRDMLDYVFEEESEDKGSGNRAAQVSSNDHDYDDHHGNSVVHPSSNAADLDANDGRCLRAAAPRHHGETATSPTTAATTTVKAGDGDPSASSRHASQGGGGTAADDEPVFDAEHGRQQQRR